LAPSGSRRKRQGERFATLALVAIAIVLVVVAGVTTRGDGFVALLAIAVSLPAYGIAMLAASDLRTRVRNAWFSGTLVIGIIIAFVMAFTLLLLSNRVYAFSLPALAGLTVWLIALINSICNRARLALTPERVALRRRLAAAREYFREELRKPSPAFSDSVYPYLLAFGLGPHVDKWFKAFSGTANATRVASGSAIGSTSIGSSSSGNSPFSGFGGGGGFSGGGGGASFGAAIGSIASSVPSPSSSSSSGGSSSSSSGGSSGGGGGGGW
jgi:uncharacterized membrane protein YgcG